ncbi:hypothetical protein MJC1_04225 [Methylocystis sp. MJC1]|nr:hypothetical protein MJC1_04225 [Methylocystis sp. MJC1]
MAVDDLRKSVSDVGQRIDAIELAGLDERGDDRPVFAASVRTREESVFPIEGDGTDCTFDDIGVDLDAPVVDEACQAVPARERVADRLGELGLLADQREFFTQPWLERVEDGAGFLLPRVPTFAGALAADVALDGVEFADARQSLAGDRRGTCCGEFVEAPADVRPAEGERHAVLLRQRAIAGVTVDLHDAREASKMRERLLGLSVLRIDIDCDWRIGAAPWPVVTRISPKLASLGTPAPGVEHRRPCLVSEDFRRRSDVFQKPLVHGPQMPGGATNPVGERRTVEGDPLPGVDLCLAIKRKMIGVFGNEHMCDCHLRRQAAFDQPRRGRRLHDRALAGATSVFGSTRHQHAELRWHDVEPLRDIFADLVERALAARTGFILDVDDGFDAREMGR